MSTANEAGSAARRRAQELSTRKRMAAERVETEAKRRQAEDAKTARLRALRLGKEAAEKGQRDLAGTRPSRSWRSPAG